MLILALVLAVVAALLVVAAARTTKPACPWGCTTENVRMECHTHTPNEAQRIEWYANQFRTHPAARQ